MPKKAITLPTSSTLPYSPAVRAGDYVFVSGQTGYKDWSGNEVKGIEAQTKQCLENIKLVLQTAASSLDDVVKVTVFLNDANDFARMNEVYQSYFPKTPPARSTIQAGMVITNMLVEIDCVAYTA
jgi:2-iminobutanoate/2-iminopropanoate deaminase